MILNDIFFDLADGGIQKISPGRMQKLILFLVQALFLKPG